MSSLRLRKALVLRVIISEMTKQWRSNLRICAIEDGRSISIDSIKDYLNFGEGSNESAYNRLLSGTG